MEKKTYIKDWIKIKKTTIASTAKKMGITPPALSLQLARPSFTSLCNIAMALNVEPWQLLAPPSVVEELKQTHTQTTHEGTFIAVIRDGANVYTADTLDELRGIVRTLEEQNTHTEHNTAPSAGD